jgi:hypothetical protein
MRRLLAKRWPWCFLLVLALVLCPLPVLLRLADPYHRVQPGMTEVEVERLLGPPTFRSMQTFLLPEVSFTLEIRQRFLDIVTIRYRDGQVIEKEKTPRSAGDLWQVLLTKVGLASPRPPARAIPEPVAPPRPLLPSEQRPQALVGEWPVVAG